MMGKHVIVGAGQVGAHAAERLAADGHEVVVVTRSGAGPEAPGVRRVAADAADRERMIELTKGADALLNCASPRYWRWPAEWPPIANSLLATAEATGAALVILSNLYAYGPVDRPMTEDLPLASQGTKAKVRIRIWEDALAAHEKGRVRVTELRGSDYFGPGCRDQTPLGERFVPRVLAGKPAQYIGDPGQPHSWTYVKDVARALVVAATDDRAYGRAWHIPTSPAMSAKAVAGQVGELAHAPKPRVSPMPHPLIRAAGLFSPLMRELEETRYQFVRPFILDSSAFETTFGVAPTPMDRALADTVEWWRAQRAAA
jgi:nucleoside-diphosphate-sugar epimerase